MHTTQQIITLEFIFILVLELNLIGSLAQSVKLGGTAVKSDCPPDSKRKSPIFVPDEGLPFCSEYQYTSCCSAQDTLAIKSSVDSLMRSSCKSCYSMVAEWKCAECHPKSAAFYEGSADCDHDTSLKLCEDYCQAIFETCKDLPFAIDDKLGAFYLNDPDGITAEEWCEKLVAPEPYCFRGRIPTGKDLNCKCADHQCHNPSDQQKKEL